MTEHTDRQALEAMIALPMTPACPWYRNERNIL